MPVSKTPKLEKHWDQDPRKSKFLNLTLDNKKPLQLDLILSCEDFESKVVKNLQCLVINNEIKLKLISCLKQGKHMQEKQLSYFLIRSYLTITVFKCLNSKPYCQINWKSSISCIALIKRIDSRCQIKGFVVLLSLICTINVRVIQWVEIVSDVELYTVRAPL